MYYLYAKLSALRFEAHFPRYGIRKLVTDRCSASSGKPLPRPEMFERNRIDHKVTFLLRFDLFRRKDIRLLFVTAYGIASVFVGELSGCFNFTKRSKSV